MSRRPISRPLELGAWLLTVLAVAAAIGLAVAPTAHAAVCSDYETQAEAQRAADTADPDHDGRYCESLPCPCAPAGVDEEPQSECRKPDRLVRLRFSASKYPNIRRHFRGAVRRGWPRVLVVNRPGADDRRDRLLRDIPTRDGFDRDEYPPAVGRGTGRGLERGRNPIGWKADVRYVESSENRAHGSSLGGQLRGLCDGTKFRYIFKYGELTRLA